LYRYILFLLLSASPVSAWSQIDTVIASECRAHNVPFAIAEYVIAHESSWDVMAIGDDGASVGLMQLQVRYLTWFADMFNGRIAFDPFDPFESVRIGIRYLSWLHERYRDWWLALVAYNAGPGLVDRGIYPASSQEYATSIMEDTKQ